MVLPCICWLPMALSWTRLPVLLCLPFLVTLSCVCHPFPRTTTTTLRKMMALLRLAMASSSSPTLWVRSSRYFDLSVPTLMGMLKNTAVEVVEKEHELKASSYQKILHEAAAEHKDKRYVINTANLFSQALAKIAKEDPESLPILAKITKDLLYHFHDLPAEVEEKKDTKKIIEEGLWRVTTRRQQHGLVVRRELGTIWAVGVTKCALGSGGDDP